MAGAGVVLLLSLVALYPVSPSEAAGLSRGTFGTYNVNLIRQATAFKERKALLIEMLQSRIQTGAPDVLCLQELIRRSDARDIVEAVKTQYPYHASLDDLTAPASPQAACSPEEAITLNACVASCLNDSTGFMNCVFVNCNDRVIDISNECFICVTAEFGADEDAELNTFSRCASVIPASEYTNSFGVLILSSYQLSDITTNDYFPDSTFRRGYVSAKVNVFRQTVICTHLTPYFPTADYSGPSAFTTAHEQQANEVKQLIEAVEGQSRIVLLGDFNHGPATPGLHWEVPTNFGLMAARGLFSVNALWCGQCTYCNDNILTGGAFPDILIDHIYLPTSRASSVIRVERMFDDVTTESGLPLSDHFGVRALLLTGRGDTRVCCKSNVLGRNVKFLDMEDIDVHIDEFCPA